MARPRLLFAWELGAHFGHVSKMAEIARALGERADIFVAAQEPASFRALAPDLPVTLLPAPFTPFRPPETPGYRAVSYPDVLRHVGWREPGPLAALVEAWGALFGLVRPDMIVAQAAPTALLAARAAGLRAATVGSGYDAPPRAEPMPPFYHWLDGEAEKAAAPEAAALEAANAALRLRGGKEMGAFADLFRGGPFLLSTFAEIDHYGDRKRFEPDHPPYLGQLVTLDQGAELAWRKGAARRIFAYLRPGGTAFEAGVEALAARPKEEDVILAAPGAPAALKARLEGGPVRLVDGPARLGPLLKRCDLGVSHGSNGVAAAFLLAGVPQVALPTQSEQVMIARALGEGGFGLGLVGRYGAREAGAAVDRALGSPIPRERAGALAKRMKGARPAAETAADALMEAV